MHSVNLSPGKDLINIVLEVSEICTTAVSKGIVAEQRDPRAFPEAGAQGAGPGKLHKPFIVNTEREQRRSGKVDARLEPHRTSA